LELLGKQMASANTIRIALMKLLKDSSDNKSIIKEATDDPGGTNLAEIPLSANRLRTSRQQAQDVQLEDPMAEFPGGSFDNLSPLKQQQSREFTASPNSFPQNPQRLSELDKAPHRAAVAAGRKLREKDPQFNVDAMRRYAEIDNAYPSELAESKLWEQYKKLTGEYPTSDLPIKYIQKTIDMILGPNKSALADDIPF
jgi:hypothetical protein